MTTTALDTATAAIRAAGFGSLIDGTSGGGCPIATAGPMIAAHWSQIAWSDLNDADQHAAAVRVDAHAAAIAAWLAEADGAGNYPDAMRASAYVWTLEAQQHQP